MRVYFKIRQEIRNLSYEFRARIGRILPQVNNNVPYVCQFARPEQAELSLTNKLEPINDPHWRDSGADSPERYAQWAFTMCGMASAAMALGHFKSKNIKPAELAEDALKHKVYLEEPDAISNMRYREFSEWIKRYGLTAEVYSRLSIRGIHYALSQGKLVMVSVNPNVRGYNTASGSQKGGHLVLVTGYDLNKDTLSINNPSGFLSTDTQINHTLPIAEFKKYYAGRGIVLS